MLKVNEVAAWVKAEIPPGTVRFLVLDSFRTHEAKGRSEDEILSITLVDAQKLRDALGRKRWAIPDDLHKVIAYLEERT